MVVGSGVGDTVVVGEVGGGFGAVLVVVVVVVVGVVGTVGIDLGAGGDVAGAGGGTAVDAPAPPDSGGEGAVPAGLGMVVAFGVGRPWREAAAGLRVAGACLADPAGLAPSVGLAAGVALPMVAARAPVAITDPAATPLVTSDSLRSALSRCWTGGEAIESLPNARPPSPNSP